MPGLPLSSIAQVDAQADALNARAAELESSRREARALAVSLNLRAEEVSATIDVSPRHQPQS